MTQLPRLIAAFLALTFAALVLVLLLTVANVVPNYVFVGSFRAELIALVLLALAVWALLTVWAWLLRTWIRSARLSERKHTVREQQAAHQAFHRRFLQQLDHEIKNPLAVIRIGVLNLQQESPSPESLERLQQQVSRLQKLLEDLRYLTEIEDYPLEKEAVVLQDVLEDAISLTQQDGRRVDLHIQQIPWKLSPVLGDQDLLLVVFRNVLENALKFTSAPNRVEVRATEDGDKAIVEIADTGIGIPAADLPNVFEDLYRGKNAHSVSGSGLGLTLVQRIMTLHNGSVEIHSREGQGTVVRLRLPVVK